MSDKLGTCLPFGTCYQGNLPHERTPTCTTWRESAPSPAATCPTCGSDKCEVRFKNNLANVILADCHDPWHATTSEAMTAREFRKQYYPNDGTSISGGHIDEILVRYALQVRQESDRREEELERKLKDEKTISDTVHEGNKLVLLRAEHAEAEVERLRKELAALKANQGSATSSKS